MPQSQRTEAHQQQTIDQLASFVRGEMSAVQTYSTAMPHVVVPRHSQVLARCLTSHQQRVDMLSALIEKLGGKVPESAGPWGALVDAIEHAAAALGTHAALKILEEGEAHGLADYRDGLKRLDDATRARIETEIIPEQVETLIQIQELRLSIV